MRYRSPYGYDRYRRRGRYPRRRRNRYRRYNRYRRRPRAVGIGIGGVLLIALLVLGAVWLLRGCEGNAKTEDITVTYYIDADGEPLSATVKDELLTLSKLPRREGYDFTGLFTEPDGAGIQVLSSSGSTLVAITRPMTLHAGWTPRTYTITFDAAGGVLATTDARREVVYGEAVPPLPVPVRDSYVFVGWENSAGELISEGEAPLAAAQIFDATAYPLADHADAVTLTARYERLSHEVTFDFSEFGLPSETIKVYHGETPDKSLFPTGTDNGSKLLLGWSEVFGGTTPFEGTVVAPLTLYPIWNEYRTLTLDLGEGMSPVTLRLLRGESYRADELSALVGVDKPGHRMGGFFTSSLYTGTPVDSVSYNGSMDILYLRWEPIDYTLTFDTLSAGTEHAPIGYRYGDRTELPIPEKKGYAFLGWSESADGSGTCITHLPADATGDKLLYAAWQRTHATVRFDYCGGYGETGQTEVGVGDAIGTLPTPDTRLGWTFRGWYTKKSGGQSIEPGFKVETDTVLYARWALKESVSFSDTPENAVIDINNSYTVDLGNLYDVADVAALQAAGYRVKLEVIAEVTCKYACLAGCTIQTDAGKLLFDTATDSKHQALSGGKSTTITFSVDALKLADIRSDNYRVTLAAFREGMAMDFQNQYTLTAVTYRITFYR